MKGKGKHKSCPIGKSCSAACISRNKICQLELGKIPPTEMGRFKAAISGSKASVLDHLSKSVVAWKAGKTLGPIVSAVLESRFNIPRELSLKMAETVIQGASATALDSAHLKNIRQFTRTLIVETSAAFVGKTTHTGVENIVSAKQLEDTLSVVIPAVTGKVSGALTAVVGYKLPSIDEVSAKISDRAKLDIQKVRNVFRPKDLEFSESDDLGNFLAEVALISYVLAHYAQTN